MNKQNSMLNVVRLLYANVFEDMTRMHPTLGTALKRDLSRLSQGERSSGLSFYTLVLPEACKWFDYSLAAGKLDPTRPPYFGKRDGLDHRPSFLGGLFDLVFEPEGTLKLNPDTAAIISIRQILLMVKKLKAECSKERTDESVRSFKEIEESLPEVDEVWNHCDFSGVVRNGHPIWGPRVEQHGQTHLFDSPDTMLQLDDWSDWEGFRRFSARVLSQFGQFDPWSIEPKHGPGAISDRQVRFVKYDQPFWTERLEGVFPYDWHASGTLSTPDYVQIREFASKMHAVPKTMKSPRLIAAEPSAHQWIQQGIRGWLEDNVKNTILSQSIDFRSQEFSKTDALDASRDGLRATVDLSSASDRLHTRLVHSVFQVNKDLLTAFAVSRTRLVSTLDGELIALRKFATQGSALTFPVQTIVYALLAIWSVALTRDVKDWRGISNLASEVRVYGDDIIVPTDAYPVLVRLLESCLLKVNKSKSYATGLFRESCGMDAYAGVEVTPAYFREAYSSSPDSLESLVAVSNNFFKKGYWRAAEYLESLIPTAERKLIPIVAIRHDGSDETGFGSIRFSSYAGRMLGHLPFRISPQHNVEVRVLDCSSRPQFRTGDGEGGLSQFMFERPDPLLKYRSGESTRPIARKRARWVQVP